MVSPNPFLSTTYRKPMPKIEKTPYPITPFEAYQYPTPEEIEEMMWFRGGEKLDYFQESDYQEI